MRRRGRVGGVAAGFASLVLLSGCAAGATPTPSSSATAAPTSSSPAPAISPTPSPTLAPSSSEATTGRIMEPEVGFAITLADGWVRNTDPGEGFYLTRGVLLAEDGLGSKIGVYGYWAFEDELAAAADPVAAVADAMSQSGSTARSAVNLPAGPAVRLEFVDHGTTWGVAWVVGGGFAVAGRECQVEDVLYVVMASFDDTVAPIAVEQMARSLELLSREAVLGAAGCVMFEANVTWSIAQHIDASPEGLNLIGWDGGFVAVSVQGGPAVWISDSGKTWRQVKFPAAPAAEWIDAEVAFGGLVIVETSTSGPAIVWGSRTGETWVELSRLSEGGACAEEEASGNPAITGVYTSGRSLVLEGHLCDWTQRIYRSDDGVVWSAIATLPSDVLSEGVAPSIQKAHSSLKPLARVGSWYVGADVDRRTETTTLRISPDGDSWTELPVPADAREAADLAGRDGLVVMATFAADRGTDIWLGEISPTPSP